MYALTDQDKKDIESEIKRVKGMGVEKEGLDRHMLQYTMKQPAEKLESVVPYVNKVLGYR